MKGFNTVNKKINSCLLNKWFTLIELIVSITIFSIIMISVMMIFSATSKVSAKIDLNRSMQENTKSIVESISRDVLKYRIMWVSKQSWASDCNLNNVDWKYKSWDKLCLWDINTGHEYFLALETASWWIRVEEASIASMCWDLNDECVLVRLDKSSWDITRISNSLVYFKDLKFYVSNENMPKVTLTFTMQPSFKKWLNSTLISNSEITFQTTFSERLIETN